MARLLADLVGRSSHPKKQIIASTFGAVRGLMQKREAITHGYFLSQAGSVIFVERKMTGDFKTIEHQYTLQTFAEFVSDFMKKAHLFEQALGAETSELKEFVEAAINLSSKPDTSPGSPSS